MATVKTIDKKTLKKFKTKKRLPSFNKSEVLVSLQLMDENVSKLLLKYFECENVAKTLVKSAYLSEYVNEQN